MPGLATIRRLFAMEWSLLLQYRIDLILWTASETIMPLVSLAIWYTVAAASPAGPSQREVFTYYIFIMFIMIITNAWAGFFLSREILEGEIVQFLTRPLSVFWKYIVNNVVEKTVKLLIPLPLLFVAVAVFRHYFAPAIFQTSHLALFIVTLLIAVVLHFNIDMVFGVLAFWLEDAMQIRHYNEMLASIASGVMIPFAFMPQSARFIFSFLPFRYYISLPVDLLLGQIDTTLIPLLIAYQITWAIGSAVLLTILWKRGLRRYAPPGQ